MIEKTLRSFAPLVLASALLAGCGGGGVDGAETPQASSQTAAAATVQIEGCVVDSQWMGVAASAVHVRASDGRLLGTAFTNRQGVFVVTVPVRIGIVLDTADSGPGEIALNTGSASLSVGACLLTGL